MIWSGWGLKDKLIGNVDVWLCHQCGDCSSYCPRDVKPADVISGVRQLSYRHYARPRFLGRLLSEPAWLPLAIAIPVLMIIGILSLAGTFRIPEGPVDYSAFFPHGLFGTRKGGKVAHMLLFFGFALLIMVTLYAIWATVTHHYPLPITNPFKILGNLASLMIYTGLGMMSWQRLRNKSVFGKSGYSDWLLLISIGLLTLSGSLVQLARFGDWSIAYHLYFFHLVAVWFVIMYLPFTKLGHIFYRTTALLYARSIGRK
jgi:quinone-modifying oxidoreductase subunit QmoC